MRILLICEHGDYRFSSWKRLESVLSAGHEAIRVARVVRDRSASDTSDDVMSAAEFESFAPDLLAMSGEPDARVTRANPFGVKPERRVPWELEQEFRAAGGAIFFFQAEGALNTWEVNPGYAEYGLPLATSVERGVNVYAGRYGTLDVVFSDWVPPAGLPGAGTGAGAPLREVVVHSPWVLDAAMAEFHPLLLTDCDVKDPVWVNEGGLANGVIKPYPVAAWTQDPAPVVLVTGDAFSDERIGNGQNEELLRILVTALSRRPRGGVAVRLPAPAAGSRQLPAGRAIDGGRDGLRPRWPEPAAGEDNPRLP
jgi:hypothetical protein